MHRTGKRTILYISSPAMQTTKPCVSTNLHITGNGAFKLKRGSEVLLPPSHQLTQIIFEYACIIYSQDRGSQTNDIHVSPPAPPPILGAETQGQLVGRGKSLKRAKKKFRRRKRTRVLDFSSPEFLFPRMPPPPEFNDTI